LMALGDAAGAVEAARIAFDRSRDGHDGEGMLAASHAAFEALRYLGRPAEAARILRAHAALLQMKGDPMAAWFMREAGIVEAGEAPFRLLVRIGDRRCELSEVAAAVRSGTGADGPIVFEGWRSRPTLERAERLTVEAAGLAAGGRLDEALAVFGAAAAADPWDPACRYHAGVTLLQLGRHGEAADRLAETARLAPGWFMVGRYTWLAEELEAGRLPPPVATVLVMSDDVGPDPLATLGLVEKSRELLPNLGWLHLNAARALEAADRRVEALAAVRAGLAGAGPADVRADLLAQLGLLLGQCVETDRAFAAVLRSRASLAAEAAVVVALAFRNGGQRPN
ncbi:MAG: tetratricopeptide repeat protein, partial [Chloroflexota bacterium]